MAENAVTDLALPIQNRHDLRRAFQLVRTFRRDPSELLRWEPEARLSLLERERREMALSLYLVATLETGAGEIESRVRACRHIFSRNVAAPADAVRAAELLFRSRSLSGSTDIETFWLAAAFAHPLQPIAPADLRDTAWAYLCHAPFNLDPRTALLFARESKALQRPPFPRWPMELVEWLMQRAHQADLGATILQAHLCVALGASDLDDLADKLASRKREPDQATVDALEQLAGYYVRVEADEVHARDIVAYVAARAQKSSSYDAYLEHNVFDLPYDELYEMVTARIDDVPALDGLYDRFADRGRLDVARRLVEAELVKRLDPWYYGGIQPHIARALSRIVAGADITDPRVRTLVVRLAAIHARTRMISSNTRQLLDRISERPEYLEDGAPIQEIRRGIGAYLESAEPKNILERERQLLEERWDDLSPAEHRVMNEVYAWINQRFRPRVEALRPAAAAAAGPTSDTFSALGEKRTAIRDAEKYFRAVYLKTFSPRFRERVTQEVERALDVPFQQVRSLDLDTVYTLARRRARQGRLAAFGLGAIAGVTSGFGGALLEVGAVSVLAARSVAHIGACFGIEPGTEEGFEFLVDTLFTTLSVDAGGGLVAYLMDQKPVARHLALVSLAQVLSDRVRTALRQDGGRGVSAAIARWLVDLSARRVPAWAPRHWRHAIALANAAAAGGANMQLYREFTDAAVHIAARRWLLERLGLEAPRGAGTEFHPAGTVPSTRVPRVW